MAPCSTAAWRNRCVMPPERPALRLRPAGPDDADRVADLHARSWRATYRGSLSDAYLDGPVAEERQAFWRRRLRHPTADLWSMLAVAEDEAGLAGFACAVLHQDDRWGTLLDNLHVDPAGKRRGIGRRLMTALGHHLQGVGSAMPVHLFVLQANHAALAFYEALGGEAVETLAFTEPDGSTPPVARMAWGSVAAFLAQGR